MTRAAIYVRISRDTTGEGLGVQRQEEDCRQLAASRGWQVVGVYSDNDISAYSGKPRPNYQRLLDDIDSKHVQAVVAWHPDRLQRSPLELNHFIDLVNRSKCKVATVMAGGYDLTTAAGRLNARVLGDFARYESEQKSERVARKIQQSADQGKTHQGGARPFGWERDRRSLNDAEAAVVRRAAELVLSGASVKTVTKAANESGIPPVGGGRWRDVQVRDMLLRPRNAGLVVYRGRPNGKTGNWEPILDEVTWRRVERILTDSARRTTPGAGGRKHLLSGLAVCGVCGHAMYGAKGKPYKGVSKDIYRCKANQCLTRDMESVDLHVSAVICERLAQPDAVELLVDREDTSADEAAAEADMLRQRLVDAASDYANDLITDEQLRTMTAIMRDRIESLDKVAQASRPRPAAMANLITATNVTGKWLDLDVAQRRAVIAELVTVTVMRTKRGPGFRPEDVEVRWRD